MSNTVKIGQENQTPPSTVCSKQRLSNNVTGAVATVNPVSCTRKPLPAARRARRLAAQRGAPPPAHCRTWALPPQAALAMTHQVGAHLACSQCPRDRTAACAARRPCRWRVLVAQCPNAQGAFAPHPVSPQDDELYSGYDEPGSTVRGGSNLQPRCAALACSLPLTVSILSGPAPCSDRCACTSTMQRQRHAPAPSAMHGRCAPPKQEHPGTHGFQNVGTAAPAPGTPFTSGSLPPGTGSGRLGTAAASDALVSRRDHEAPSCTQLASCCCA